jgi:hypothetical protein
MILSACISLVLAVLLVARWTVNRMKREDYIDHRRPVKEWLIKAASGIPSVLLFWYQWHWWAFLLVPTWYFLLFDSTIGVMMKKGVFYSGTVWAGQAKTASIPFWAKTLFCIVSTYFYIKF